MKRMFKYVVLYAIVSLCSISCMLAEEPPGNLVDFTLKDINQNPVVLSSYKEKQPVVLFFWTTWCPFCRQELKTLTEKSSQLTGEGWEVLAIDAGETEGKVNDYIKKHPVDFKVLLDADMRTTKSLRVVGVPTFILLNKHGSTVFRGHYFPYDQYKDLIKE